MTSSRLPIPVAAAAGETASSYINRLARLHGMPCSELWHQATRARAPGSTTRVIAGALLATVTGLHRDRRSRSVIELYPPDTDWLGLRHEAQRPCPGCAARYPGGHVLQVLPHHRYVCLRHRFWIGPPDLLDLALPRLDAVPEVVAAQHRHLRLLHRMGPAATYDAVLTGFLICGHLWNDEYDHAFGVRGTWDRRAELLIPPGTETTSFATSRLFAAVYPEAVDIAALIGSLHWRRLAAGGPAQQRHFAAEIGRQLGDPGYRPQTSGDPIAHWIDADCWQPPSLPETTYNHTRAFNRPNTSKIPRHSLERHQRSARWFAVNRNGGRGILYHRHIMPVLVRDWSIPMDLFIDTVYHSATTWKFHDQATQKDTTKDTNQPAITQYLRPFPAPSPYLDTATTPAPWPIQDTTVYLRGGKPQAGRPFLGSERRRF